MGYEHPHPRRGMEFGMWRELQNVGSGCPIRRVQHLFRRSDPKLIHLGARERTHGEQTAAGAAAHMQTIMSRAGPCTETSSSGVVITAVPAVISDGKISPRPYFIVGRDRDPRSAKHASTRKLDQPLMACAPSERSW